MDVYINGKVCNKRIVTTPRKLARAVAQVRARYGGTPIKALPEGDRVALYWRA